MRPQIGEPLADGFGTAVTRGSYRRRFRSTRLQETRATLPPVLLGVAIAHLVFAAITLLFATPQNRWIYAAVPAGAAVVVLFLRSLLGFVRLRERHTLLIAFLSVLATLTYPAYIFVATGSPQVGTLLLLVVAGTGAVSLWMTMVATASAISIAVYLWVWRSTEGGTEWSWWVVGFMLVLACLVAVAGSAVRIRMLRRMLDLRIRDETNLRAMSHAVRAAAESEIRFRRLAEATFEAIIVHDQGRIVDANPAAATLAGIPLDHLIGLRLDHFIPVAEVTTLRDGETVERMIRRPNGEVRHLELRGRTIPYGGGEARVIAIRDVTDARRLESEKVQLAERLEHMLAAAAEGVFGVDKDGYITFVNPAALDLLGYRGTEVLGQHSHRLFHHSRADGAPYPVEECPIYAACKQGAASRVDNETFWRRDGSAMPVEFSTGPISEQGRVAGAVVVFRDISERREVERMKDELVSVVSHELKTPLTSIHGSLRLLAADRLGTLPPQAKRMVDIAESNTDRLMRLVNDILDLERLRAGKMLMRKRLVDVHHVVEEAVETMRPLAQAGTVGLQSQVEPLVLWCDPDRVMQALTNLLSNAIKFSPPGSKVDVRVRQADGRARIEVSDRGPGVPAEMRDRLFQRFAQADSSDARKQGGTGLGLAISKQIVEGHGGEIGLMDRPGGGSIFWFTLPVAPPVQETKR